MNKQELLSTYTAEQLAEMVEKLDTASRMMAETNRSLEKENVRLKKETQIYHNYILPKATKDAYEQIMENHYTGIRIVTWDEWNNRGKPESEKVFLPKEYENYIKEILNIDTSEIKDDCHRFSIEGLQRHLKMDSPKKQSEIDSLKEQLTRSQTTINQIDNILKDLFGATFEICETKEDFDGFKRFLEKNIKEAAISNFLPAEPIKIADMLISTTYTRKKGDMEKALHKAFGNNEDTVTESAYSVSELRQIAEHLLVYCNANGEEKE